MCVEKPLFEAVYHDIFSPQRALADLLVKLLAINGALEIFERLELWDDVIACLQTLGRKEQVKTFEHPTLLFSATI